MCTDFNLLATVLNYCSIFLENLNVHSVTFVIQAPSDNRNRLSFCTHLLQHWIAQGLSPYCLVQDQNYADFLDDFLWSQHATFIPHTQSDFHEHRVQAYIGTQLPETQTHRPIFNYTNQAIDLSAQSHPRSIIEWVNQDTKDKANMRAVFARYKACDLNPRTIRLDHT